MAVITSPNLGQKPESGSSSVVQASSSTFAVTNTGVGAIADAAATSDTGSFSLIAFVKRLTAHIFAPRINYGVLISTINDNTIVAAPTAGNEWVMTTARIQANAATVTTVLIKKGASDPNPLRLRTVADGGGLSEVYGFSEAIHFGNGNPIIVNLSAAAAHGVSITYYRASVSTGLPT